ncbi:MAG TPA: uracil-DNA glycosylase family protein [Fibrobacteria bacterium]|jgi:DNA polymerase|nr:uracil-DNA glycosylase family protein [Fibrobacteria bacterium]
MTSRLDAYLAWQSEIGTAEVVLAEPWVKPTHAHSPAKSANNPDARGAAAPASHRNDSVASRVSAISAPEDFFRDIERRLAERPSAKPAAPKAKVPAPSPSPVKASNIPDSLEEYWAWLAEEYPRWFPSSSASIVRAEGNPGARLAVVELFPTGGTLFAGDAGALLDKMMQAIGLSRDALYLTSVMKTPPSGKSWARKDVARALPSFLAELRLAGCGEVLLLGEACAQAVLRTGKSLAALDVVGETTADAGDIAFTAAWHPADLLGDAKLKAPAWERLKALKSRLEGNKA